jgi:hypothetical protein
VVESSMYNSVLLVIGSRKDARLFRNNVGTAYVGVVFEESPKCVTLVNYRRIRFGLQVGSSDFIGLKSVTIKPEMVGKKVAVFVGLEAKKKGKKATDAQGNWIDMIREAGGISGVFTSIDEANEIVGKEGEIP